MARRLVGLQAQDARPPFVGLWARLEGLAVEDVHVALAARELVRAPWARGTLHLVAADDYLGLRAALAPVLEQAALGLGRRMEGIDPARVLPVARELLDGRPRTQEELRQDLAGRFPGTDERALGHVTRLMLAVVMVPSEDRWGFPPASRFTLADRWLGRPPDRDTSPAELVRRYLAALAPATPADAQAWSGLPGLRAAFEELRGELATFRDEAGASCSTSPRRRGRRRTLRRPPASCRTSTTSFSATTTARAWSPTSTAPQW